MRKRTEKLSPLAERVKYPDWNHYLLSLVEPSPLVQKAYRDYPFLSSDWVDLSELDSGDIGLIDDYLAVYGISWSVAELTKSQPD